MGRQSTAGPQDTRPGERAGPLTEPEAQRKVREEQGGTHSTHTMF